LDIYFIIAAECYIFGTKIFKTNCINLSKLEKLRMFFFSLIMLNKKVIGESSVVYLEKEKDKFL
jgi:hypothetical protein